MIEAQEMLKQITVAMAPNMKRTQYEKLHRDLHRKAYPKTYDGPAVGAKELARILGAGRI